MNKNRIVAIAVAAAVITAAAAMVLMPGKGVSEKKGLYKLDAEVIEVNMGGISATPEFVDSIERMYVSVYGKEVGERYTLADARADTAFWNRYCSFTPVAVKGDDGKITVKSTIATGQKIQVLDAPLTEMISMGSIYSTGIYYILCQKHGVKPFSEEAASRAELIGDFRGICVGGTRLSYFDGSPIQPYFDRDAYLDSGKTVTTEYDLELLGNHVKTAVSSGDRLAFVGSGAGMKKVSEAAYANFMSAVTTNGGVGALFFSASDIPEAFASVHALGCIFGLDSATEELMAGMQAKLYNIYMGIQESGESHKVYWENTSGKSIKNSGMASQILAFFGWDTSLVTGAEVDTETLLAERPDVLVFYSNDGRSMDERMRVGTAA